MAEDFKYVKLDRLNELCGGERAKYLKFLKQFSTLLPKSINNLEMNLEAGNMDKVFRAIHHMNPHLSYFGIDVFSVVNSEQKTWDIGELGEELKLAILIIKYAIDEVDLEIERLNETPQ